MLIAQMTDIHIGFEPDAPPEELNRVRFRSVLARLKKQPNPIDMLVLSGDLTDRGDADSYEKMAAELHGCDFPIYPMVGNHDAREEFSRVFPNCPINEGFVQYSVDAGGMRVIMLDTLEEGRHGGAFCEARAAWLKAQLAAHEHTPTLIFMHHPPIVSGIGWMDPAPEEPWMVRLGEVLEGQKQIMGIACGHLHRPVATLFRGIPLWITPSVAPLVSLDLREISPDKPDNRALITTEPPVYALHHWDGSRFLSHLEMVNNFEVLAYYGTHLQPMIREMFAERQ